MVRRKKNTDDPPLVDNTPSRRSARISNTTSGRETPGERFRMLSDLCSQITVPVAQILPSDHPIDDNVEVTLPRAKRSKVPDPTVGASPPRIERAKLPGNDFLPSLQLNEDNIGDPALISRTTIDVASIRE